MDAAEPPDKPDLESLPPTGDDPAVTNDPASAKPRGKQMLMAAGAVVVIAGAAALGVHAASGGKAGATPGTVATNNGSSTQSFNGEGPGGGNGFAGRLGGRGAFGTISAINGSTLSVKGSDGTTTKVATSSKTAVTTSADSSVAAIAVGDHVTVIGSGSSTQLAAQRITDTGDSDLGANGFGGGGGFGGPPGGRGTGNGSGNENGSRPSFNGGTPPGGGGGSFTAQSGTVKSISGSTITLTTSSGSTVTVTTSSSTTVTRTTKSTVSALKVGDQVVATGTTKNGTLTANAIREGDAGGFGGRFGRGGFNGTPTTTGQTS